MDNQHFNLKALSSILDEYASWYGDLLACVFYSSEKSSDGLEKVHLIFSEWLNETRNLETLENEYLDRIERIHADLVSVSQSILDNLQSKSLKPDFDTFEKFSGLFEEFLNNMRRLEKDSVLEDSGIDVLTGLRSKNTLHTDLAREMERLARRGRPFCLALARIDYYDDIVKEHGRDVARQSTKAVSQLIKKSMRSFDDGYRLGNGEFVLSLKQADMLGGVAALERLKKLLEGDQVSINLNGNNQLLTMSCCIAEPVPEDNVDDLITNLRDDLNSAEKSDAGSVLEYHEMSDLERYLQDQIH